MEKKFIIGDREKNEWVSVFDNAEIDLKLLQATGFFGDLRVYLFEDGKAFVAGERDGFL